MFTLKTRKKIEQLLEAKIIKVTKPEDQKETIRLNVQKTADGNIMVDDNAPFFVYVIPSKALIFTVPKDQQDELILDKQQKFFDFLVKKGVTIPTGVTGGEIFNSYEAKYSLPEDEDGGVLGFILKSIAEYIQDEEQDGQVSVDYIKSRLKYLVGGQSGTDDMAKISKRDQEYMNKSGYHGMGAPSIRDIPAYSSYYFE
jgi:hypothetical protein